MRRVLLSWSSGKDSAWALHLLRQRADVEVVALATSFNGSANRVAMHAVRRVLVQEQAKKVELPLWTVDLPSPCTNADYEELMKPIWERAAAERVSEVAFGDLFLQDIRTYRERQLQPAGLTAIFPVWGLPTDALAQEMIRAGVKAKITCVDPAKLEASYAGRDFDAAFVSELPAGIDPCGENGEFHTFVYDSPVFTSAIPVSSGEIVKRDGFVFADVLTAATDPRIGLCGSCSNASVVTSDRGAEFYRCLLAAQNPEFAKYPRLPVLSCPGWR